MLVVRDYNWAWAGYKGYKAAVLSLVISFLIHYIIPQEGWKCLRACNLQGHRRAGITTPLIGLIIARVDDCTSQLFIMHLPMKRGEKGGILPTLLARSFISRMEGRAHLHMDNQSCASLSTRGGPAVRPLQMQPDCNHGRARASNLVRDGWTILESRPRATPRCRLRSSISTQL